MKLNRNIMKCTGFLFGIIILLIITSYFFRRKDGIYTYDSLSVSVKSADIKAEPADSLDVLFFGDSESYAAFYPNYLYSKFGYTSFVCGTAAQKICDTYAILKNAFETQSPKVIVLETNSLFRELKEKDKKSDPAMDYLTDTFPTFANHTMWKRWARNLLPKSRDIKRRKEKGFIVRKNVIPYKGGKYMYETKKTKKVPKEITAYLEKIINLCEENEAILLLVSTPSPKNWNYAKHNGTKLCADTYHISYIDLNLDSEIDIDWSTDTKDGGDHLNLAGAKKVTKYMGKYFRDNFDLTDKRNNREAK